MTAKIIKVYKELLPAVQFIGKCYTNADRKNGGFGEKWGEWFQNGWFEALETAGKQPEIENGYLGLMLYNPHDTADSFAYWIGLFFTPGTPVPTGFESFLLESGSAGVCWIQGQGDGSLYQMHENCIQKLGENGMDHYKMDDKNRICCFERYNCPRFTDADENGNVILDYGVYLSE